MRPILKESHCNSSDQLPYPMSDQPMTDLLCERSDDIPTDSNTVHGWNMEFLGGWEIEYVCIA